MSRRSHEQKQYFREGLKGQSRQLFGDTLCRLCGAVMCANSLQAHHVKPLNSGGENDPINNGVLVRGECHKDLHDQYTGKLTPLGVFLFVEFMKDKTRAKYGNCPRR